MVYHPGTPLCSSLLPDPGSLRGVLEMGTGPGDFWVLMMVFYAPVAIATWGTAAIAARIVGVF